MADVRQRLLQASGASGVSLIARMLEQLLFVPVLLAAWSVELFGEWLLIAAIPVYLALLDFGVVQSGSNELAKRAGDGDEQNMARFFRDYSSAFLLWSLILFALLVVLVLVSPVSDWLRLSAISNGEAQGIFVLLIAGTLVSQNSLALIAGMRARRILPAGLLVRATGAFLRLGAAFIAVGLLDAGPIELAAILLISRIAEYGILALILAGRDLAPALNPFRKRTESLRGFLGSGMEFMLFPLAQSLILQGAVVVVGMTFGAAAVAIFVTHRTLSRMVSQVVQLAVVPLRAEAGLLQADEQKAELGAILLSVSRLTFWAAIIVAAGLMALGPWFFEVWTGGKILFLPILFATLLLATLFEALWSVSSTIRMGTNRHRPLAWSYLAVSLAGLVLMLGLSQTGSLSLLSIGIVMAELMMTLIAIPITLSLVGLQKRSFLLGHCRPPIAELGALWRRVVSGAR